MNVPDKIRVSAIDCVAAIGVTDAERASPQHLAVDVEVSTSIRKAAATDALADALDYAEIVRLASQLAGSRRFNLIETLAECIADRLLAEVGGEAVHVVVRKSPPTYGRPRGIRIRRDSPKSRLTRVIKRTSRKIIVLKKAKRLRYPTDVL